MAGHGSITANFIWSTYSYTVSISGLASGSTNVYLDGSAKATLSNGQSYTFSGLSGSHIISVDNPVSGGSGTRYYCSQSQISVSGSGSYTFSYKTQYYLTVSTDPSGITSIAGSGWYDSGSSATTGTAPSTVTSGGTTYTFSTWRVDGSQVSGNPITVTMNAPHMATAVYTSALPGLSVEPIEPSNGASLTSSPINLKVRVTSSGSAVQGATVRFYVDSLLVGSSYSDSNGYASISYSPSPGSHSWYTTAEKSGYNSGTSPIVYFTYNPPQALAVQVQANPSSIITTQSSTITVTVTSEGSLVPGALISLSTGGGSLNPTSGITDSNGKFTSTFTSSSTGTFTITASASKSGYTPGSGSTQVTVSTQPLNAPSGLTATAVSSSQINLAWTDNSNDESDFHIERRVSGDSWTKIATVPANILSYSDTGLSASTTYYYRIRAHRHSDNIYSSYSNEASATTLAPPPQTGNLYVYVKDSNNNPIAGASVISTSQPSGQSQLSRATDSNGFIAFNNIKTGSYMIQASKADYQTSSQTTTVTSGQTTTITITIYPSNEKPVAKL